MPVKLVLADVDGTFVTHEKVLTRRAIDSVRALGSAGVAFGITSGRPPRGMEMFVDPLRLSTPLAAFNGGELVRPNLTLIEQHVLTRDIVAPILEILASHQLDAWIYRDKDWFVRERHGRHVDREEWTVKFPPTIVADFTSLMNDVVKVVGVSDDPNAIARSETDVLQRFASRVSAQQTAPQRDQHPTVFAARSQPYYLDVTHPLANKGAVVLTLSRLLKISPQEIATIGDMPNDIAMFQQSGLSIAMGQSKDEVKRAATYVTTSSEEQGFANAIERFVLART